MISTYMLLKKDFKIHEIDASIFFNIHFHINTYLGVQILCKDKAEYH